MRIKFRGSVRAGALLLLLAALFAFPAQTYAAVPMASPTSCDPATPDTSVPDGSDYTPDGGDFTEIQDPGDAGSNPEDPETTEPPATDEPGTSTCPGPPGAAHCAVSVGYTLSSSSIRMPFKAMPTFRNGPGGEMRVSRTTDKSVSFQVTAGSEVEAGAVIAKAKVSISASLTKTNSSSVVNQYVRTITPRKFGNARYVSYGKKVNYRKYRRNESCSTTTLRTGTINIPSTTEGWYYWETSS